MTRVAMGFDASRSAALSAALADYRIVHFATHGHVDDSDPRLSGLVLSLVDADGEPTDGFLRPSDIADMSLNADLVTLSACETALGEEIDGEGLVGLARAFMDAGAQRVLSTLWRVDDDATAALMELVYHGILKEGRSPAEALAQAQRRMRAHPRWRSPFYWAGISLQGELGRFP
jgi:CHAT domain-containing protein